MSEHTEQVAIFHWAALNQGAAPELDLLHATMNGAWLAGSGRNKFGLIRKYKDAGMKNGVPDICLPVARAGWHGLWIELKVGKNKPTGDQLWWLERLNEQGYRAVVCYGADQAIRCISEYLGITNQV